jgi:hypothetical protein
VNTPHPAPEPAPFAVPGADFGGHLADPVRGADPVEPGLLADPAASAFGADPADPAGPVHSDTVRRPWWRPLALGAVVVAVLTALGVPLGLLWAAVTPGIPVQQTGDGPVLVGPQPEQFVAADGWFTLLGLGFGALAALAVWQVLRRDRGPVGLVAVGLGTIGAALIAWWLGRNIGLAEYHRLVESAPVGQIYTKPADLRAGGFTWLFGTVPVIRGDLLVPAFAAAVTYTLLAGWSAHPSLRPEPAGGVGQQPGGPSPDATLLGEPLSDGAGGGAFGGPEGGGAAPDGAAGFRPGPDEAPPAPPVSWRSPAPPAPTAAPGQPGPDGAAPPPA